MEIFGAAPACAAPRDRCRRQTRPQTIELRFFCIFEKKEKRKSLFHSMRETMTRSAQSSRRFSSAPQNEKKNEKRRRPRCAETGPFVFARYAVCLAPAAFAWRRRLLTRRLRRRRRPKEQKIENRSRFVGRFVGGKKRNERGRLPWQPIFNEDGSWRGGSLRTRPKRRIDHRACVCVCVCVCVTMAEDGACGRAWGWTGAACGCAWGGCSSSC